MKLFNFVSSKVVDTYAKELAHDFSRLCPLSTADGKNRGLEKQVEKNLSDILGRAKTFRAEYKLGIFKRARFAKKFQDELAFLGYAPELVNRVTTALVTSALSAE